ncbi:MAG: DUF4105 domain-containing protein [Flavobacteriaceae bacterium]|nr:DUF4105 domain-containing protein [Flavobacteriaceae bacterium]
MIRLYLILFCLSIHSLYCINKTEGTKTSFEEVKVSIISIGEGSSLADAFGHTGIRVISNGNDIVFNFGVYDFSAPNFYSNFVKGRPVYKLAVQKYENFKDGYIYQNRYLVEHELNMSEESKMNIIDLLVNNSRPENKYYTNDYLRDNCSTRVADILIDDTNNKFRVDKLESEAIITYRKLIHEKISENSWAALGIDLCLGAIIDKKISVRETFFIPEKLMKYMDELMIYYSKPITKNIIFSPDLPSKYNEEFPKPFLVNLIISLLIILLTYFNFKNNSWNRSIDFIIYLFSGLIGVLIIYLWFFSNHFASAQNFNFLWAFPFNLAVVFALIRKTPPLWTINFVKLNIILLILLFIHWTTGVQKYNITLLPIFISLLVRYSYLVIQINKTRYENLQ